MSAVGIFVSVIMIIYLAWWAWDERATLTALGKIILGIDKCELPDIPPISIRDLDRMHDRINRIGKVDFPGYDRFEAWTQCPACDRIAVHDMRKPKSPNEERTRRYESELARWQSGDRDTHYIKSWGGETVRAIPTPAPKKPFDETIYDTIRTCECGQEWGQR